MQRYGERLFQPEAVPLVIDGEYLSLNWLIGCYIVEYEQHGEDRADYGEKLLKNLEIRVKKKGLTERRFREFRRLYIIYPQLGSEVMGYLSDVPLLQNNSLEDNPLKIRRMSAESGKAEIRRTSGSTLTKFFLFAKDPAGIVLSPADRVMNSEHSLSFCAKRCYKVRRNVSRRRSFIAGIKIYPYICI